jgi:carboxyl-terminal processing protease
MRRNAPAQGLVSPPSNVRFEGTIALLINNGTGSAAELFAGIMQGYGRAGLIGQHTAGKVYLKSIFDLPDGATLELTVAKGFLFNGNPVDVDGLQPNIRLDDDDKMLDQAVVLMSKL